MSMHLVVILILLVVWWDAGLLKTVDPGRYLLRFRASIWNVAVVVAGVLLMIWMSAEPWERLPLVVTLLILPVYVWRRRRFLRDVRQEGAWAGSPTPDTLKSDAFGVILWWFLYLMFGGIAVQALHAFLPERMTDLDELILTSGGSFVVLLVLIYRAARHFSPAGFFANVGFRRQGQPWWRIYGVPVLVGILFAVISSSIILNRSFHPETPLSEILAEENSAETLTLFLLLALLVAPLAEEIIFRGYFYHVIDVAQGRKAAIAVIALSFGILHMGQYWGDWGAIAMVGVLGWSLTWMRARTASTIPGVVTHYVYNIGVTLIPVVLMYSANPDFYEYQAYQAKLEPERKEELLLASLERQPDRPEIYNELAWIYSEEMGRPGEALELVNQALARDAANYDYLDTKAKILFQLGRDEEGMAIRKDLQERDPQRDLPDYLSPRSNKIPATVDD